jgi:hypothetical protein
MYEYLYCMLSGYPGKTLNPETAAYVLDSLNDLALDIRERGMQQETFFLDRVQRISGQLRQYAGKMKQTKVCIVEQVKTGMTGSTEFILTLVATLQSIITELKNVLHHLWN